MKKISLEDKSNIYGGYVWNGIVALSVITSVSVSLVSNVLNIINSTKTLPDSIQTEPSAKVYGANTNLIVHRF